MNILISFSRRKNASYKKIVVSVCAGRGETEMHSKELCLCLDTDKRSLFSSALATKYLLRGKGNVLHHHHNMKDGLLPILKSIKAKTSLPIHVLFQHPSPTGGKESRDDIASATLACASAVTDHIIESICYVYDYNTSGKTCWKDNEFQNTCLSKCSPNQRRALCISTAKVVCDIGSTSVNHPVLEFVQRCGWALMKKGCEIPFSITRV